MNIARVSTMLGISCCINDTFLSSCGVAACTQFWQSLQPNFTFELQKAKPMQGDMIFKQP